MTCGAFPLTGRSAGNQASLTSVPRLAISAMETRERVVHLNPLHPSDGKTTVTIVVASSRVGQETISALVARYASQVHIRAVFRSEEKAQSLAQFYPSVEIFVGGKDIFSQDVLVRAFKGAHKALIVAPQTEDRHLTVNKILDFAAQEQIAHVVLIGGVFQEEEKFLFHRQWQASRKHANTLGLKWTQLECSDFCENLYRSKESIRTEGLIHGAGAEGVSAPVALEDIGRAAALVLACEGCQYHNLGLKIVGPEQLSPLQIADSFSRVLGRPIRFVDIGVRKARENAMAAGLMPAWQAQGFYDWIDMYFMTGRLRDVVSDLPSMGIEPLLLGQWIEQRIDDFKS